MQSNSVYKLNLNERQIHGAHYDAPLLQITEHEINYKSK